MPSTPNLTDGEFDPAHIGLDGAQATRMAPGPEEVIDALERAEKALEGDPFHQRLRGELTEAIAGRRPPRFEAGDPGEELDLLRAAADVLVRRGCEATGFAVGVAVDWWTFQAEATTPDGRTWAEMPEGDNGPGDDLTLQLEASRRAIKRMLSGWLPSRRGVTEWAWCRGDGESPMAADEARVFTAVADNPLTATDG